jgi:hypothetical protein
MSGPSAAPFQDRRTGFAGCSEMYTPGVGESPHSPAPHDRHAVKDRLKRILKANPVRPKPGNGHDEKGSAMIDTPIVHWAALRLVFATGLLLGWILSSNKMAGRQRLSLALTLVAMAILFAPSAVNASAAVQIICISISSALLLGAVMASAWALVGVAKA